MEVRNKQERLIYVDLLRILATIAVINIHVACPFLYRYNENVKYWWVGNAFDSVSRWAVPIFIMISGVFLLDNKKEIDILYFIKKRFSKVLIPLIFWAFIYSYWGATNNSQVFSLKTCVKEILEGKVYFHLWFLYMILGIYLSAPILSVYTQNASRKNLKYFLTIWFLASSLIGLVSKFGRIELGIKVEFISGYIGYFVLGNYINKYDINKKNKNYIYALAVLCVFVTAIGTYFLTANNKGVCDGYFYGYFSPNVIIIATAIFILFKDLFNKNINIDIKTRKIIEDISNCTFGIYLIHILVLEIMSSGRLGFKLSIDTLNPIFSIPIIIFIVSISSYIIIYFFKKIPIIRTTVS